MDDPMSKAILISFLSAATGRKVVAVEIIPNEPPVEHLEEKQLRYDFICLFDDGDHATVEMVIELRPDEIYRAQYYVAKSFIAQKSKGEQDYSKLKEAYQITILAKGKMFKDDRPIHELELRDKESNIPIDSKIHIITFELSKLKKLKKDIKDMDHRELWGLYLALVGNNNEIDKLNKIMELEGGTAMATEMLKKLSADSRMQAIADTAAKREKDYLSGMKMKYDSGLRRGKREGKREGKLEGKLEGILEGELRGKLEGKLEVARNLLNNHLDMSLVVASTGLSVEQIKNALNIYTLS
jgi:predicted transposase/invertase (TIGR01784 family)